MAAVAVAEPSKEVATGLEIVANRKELLAELTAVIGIVERKTTIPILTNLLLEAKVNLDSGRSELLISSTNLDQSIQTLLPVTIRSEGAVTVPARKLYDYIKLLAADDVSIREEENNWIYVRAGRSKTRMVGMSRKNYPAVPIPEGDAVELDAKALREITGKVLLTVSNEESRYTLNGALLLVGTGDSPAMVMVSTDGHRLTRVASQRAGTPSRRIMVPAAALRELRSLLAANEDVETALLWESNEAIFFRVAHTVMSTRKLTGQFPSYEAVIPKIDGPAVVLEAAVLAGIVERCLVFANTDSRAVAIHLAEKELRMHSAAADIGETDETLDIYGGPEKPFTIGFNGQYLKEFFASINGNVEMYLNDARRAALFTWCSDDGIALDFVAMPMMLDGGKK